MLVMKAKQPEFLKGNRCNSIGIYRRLRMKDGIVIKAMWLLLGGAAKRSLPVLGVDDPEAFHEDLCKELWN